MTMLGAGKACAVNECLICLEMPSSKIPLVIASGMLSFVSLEGPGYQTDNYEHHEWKSDFVAVVVLFYYPTSLPPNL